MRDADYKIYEYACHEGNEAMKKHPQRGARFGEEDGGEVERPLDPSRKTIPTLEALCLDSNPAKVVGSCASKMLYCPISNFCPHTD